MKTAYSICLLTIILGTSFNAFARVSTEPAIVGNTNAVAIHHLAVNHDGKTGMNVLVWETANSNEVNYFMIEKTVNGIDYTTIGYVFAGEISKYRFKTADLNSVEYRVKAVSRTEAVCCSSSVKFSGK